MPVKRGRGYGASFGEVFVQVQAYGICLVDTAADDSKPSGTGGSGNASTADERKAA